MPAVLCHGDVWTYNYLFNSAADDQLVAIIDWGDCFRCSCMFDIVVLMYEADVADRANILIEDYFQVGRIYIKTVHQEKFFS
jgi:thiamine kinase-like enzyme